MAAMWLIVFAVAFAMRADCHYCPSGLHVKHYVDERGEWCATKVLDSPLFDKWAVQKSYKAASDACEKLKLGDAKWRLPIANTFRKNQEIADFLSEIASKGNLLHPHIWLGLRRSGGNRQQWADTKHWTWVDGTSLEEMQDNNLNVFWVKEEVNVGEECALAWSGSVSGHKSLQWRTFDCHNSSESFNVIVICESGAKYFFEWWFYAVCAALIIISVGASAGACVLLCRYASKRKHHRDQRKPDRRSQREKRRPSYSWRGAASGRNAENDAAKLSYYDVGPKSPGAFKKQCKPTGEPDASLTEDDNPYSNVEPARRRGHIHSPKPLLVRCGKQTAPKKLAALPAAKDNPSLKGYRTMIHSTKKT